MKHHPEKMDQASDSSVSPIDLHCFLTRVQYQMADSFYHCKSTYICPHRKLITEQAWRAIGYQGQNKRFITQVLLLDR